MFHDDLSLMFRPVSPVHHYIYTNKSYCRYVYLYVCLYAFLLHSSEAEEYQENQFAESLSNLECLRQNRFNFDVKV